jgi:hypothetical protein
MPGKDYKIMIWLAFSAIIILCWLDYSLFTEGHSAFIMTDSKRKLAHIAMLILVVAAGYIGWLFHPQRWLKSVWLYVNIVPIVLLLTAGIICYDAGIADKQFLKPLGNLRLLLCSPVLYFIFYILSVITGYTSASGVIKKRA